MTKSQTICALATGPLPTAIALVRVSGSDIHSIVAYLCGRDLSPRRTTLCKLRDQQGDPIDEGLVVYLPCPHSYTGEDMLEISVHGGRAVVDHLLDSLLANKTVRLAEPGEFTRRAFEAGRLDLTRAEAVADIVAAESRTQKNQALRQLDGALANVYEVWRSELLRALALVEVSIDFPDEDDAPGETIAPLKEILERLIKELAEALSDNQTGERIREGFHVVIVGPPNAGKSSILNRLSKREAAIVSDRPGTTRDIVEVRLSLAGVTVRLSDTAGLRDSEDVVEVEGVRRAISVANNADVRIHVVDGINQKLPTQEVRAKDIVVINKIDLDPSQNVAGLPERTVSVSAKTGAGFDELEDRLRNIMSERVNEIESPLITRYRHRAVLTEGLASLKEALATMQQEEGSEITGEALRRAERSLRKLVGAVSVEDVLGAVFSQFCIGK